MENELDTCPNTRTFYDNIINVDFLFLSLFFMCYEGDHQLVDQPGVRVVHVNLIFTTRVLIYWLFYQVVVPPRNI